MYENLIMEKHDGVIKLTLNRPRQLNAINSQLLSDLEQALLAVDADKEAYVVILTGSGDKAFAAGADIDAMKHMTPDEGRAFAEHGQRVFGLIERLRQPVIAMIQGYALGGGCELAMACDFRIASDKASFGQPEAGLGVTTGFGGTQRLPRLVGRGNAMLLLSTGSKIDAIEALRIGLVDRVYTHDRLQEETVSLARAITGNPAAAIQQIKRCVYNGLEAGLEAGLSYESQAFGLCFSFPEQKSRMETFLNRHH